VKVGIVGIGHGKFGNRSDATVQELAFEPFKQAIEDTKNLRREDIDALVCRRICWDEPQINVAD